MEGNNSFCQLAGFALDHFRMKQQSRFPGQVALRLTGYKYGAKNKPKEIADGSINEYCRDCPLKPLCEPQAVTQHFYRKYAAAVVGKGPTVVAMNRNPGNIDPDLLLKNPHMLNFWFDVVTGAGLCGDTMMGEFGQWFEYPESKTGPYDYVALPGSNHIVKFNIAKDESDVPTFNVTGSDSDANTLVSDLLKEWYL